MRIKWHPVAGVRGSGLSACTGLWCDAVQCSNSECASFIKPRFVAGMTNVELISASLARIFHKLPMSPRWSIDPYERFVSVGRMNHYATPSSNFPMNQYPARSSHEFMKYPG